MEKLINILVIVALAEMMVSIGLTVTFAQVAAAARSAGVVAKAIFGNFVLVPAITVFLLVLFHAQPMVAAGFLIVGTCPGAPFAPVFTTIARGNVPMSVGLMVVLAGTSTVISPALLRILLPAFFGGGALHVDVGKLVGTLLATQLLPLLLGLVMRRWWPRLADSLTAPLNVATKVVNVIVVALILAVQYRMLAQIRLTGFAGMLLLLVSSLLIGWFAGGSDSHDRKAMSQTTAIRNFGVAMVIAAGSFRGTPALSAVVAYAVVCVGGALLLAVFWGHQKPAKIQAKTGAAA